MIRLFDNEIFLLDGQTVVEESIVQPEKETARKETISYGILKQHNASQAMDFPNRRNV